MADESGENRGPGSERAGQAPRDGESKQPDLPSNRRRIIFASLLAAPAVVTLGARSVRAQTPPTGSCTTSHANNPLSSSTCH
jgi:hypothetical protein